MIDQIKEKVIQKLKDHPKRLTHVFGVAETARILATIHQVSEDKAIIAGLYHDIAKYDTIEEQTRYLDLDTINHFKAYPVIFHAYGAASYLKEDFKIDDEEILNAIRHHVWGRPNMSTLEKIIFISDSCEPNRKYADCQRIFELAKINLDEALWICMDISLEKLIEKGKKPSFEQMEAHQYYMEVTRGKNK
jgi:predicted HD superfamily hydrolase involved in NAD metabolism